MSFIAGGLAGLVIAETYIIICFLRVTRRLRYMIDSLQYALDRRDKLSKEGG